MNAFILHELGEAPRRAGAQPCVCRSDCVSPPPVCTCSLGTVGCATELEAAGNPSFLCVPFDFIPLCVSVSASSLSSLELTLPFFTLSTLSLALLFLILCVCVCAGGALSGVMLCSVLFFFHKDTQRKKRTWNPWSVARLLPVADIVQSEVAPAGAGLPAWAFLPAAWSPLPSFL